tara:strand:- start:937 stop:1275 length:339 start_codon:yes stop_codon:yes gene_type:complete
MGSEKMKLTPDCPTYQDLYRKAWVKQIKIDFDTNPRLRADASYRKSVRNHTTENSKKGGRPKTSFKNLPDRAKIINNMKLKDMTNEEISSLTGISPRSINEFIERYHLPRKD